MIRYNGATYKIEKIDIDNHCVWIDTGNGFLGVSFFIAEFLD